MLTLLVAATLSLTACKKDEQPHVPGLAKKLTRVTEDADNYSTFEYNADGNLSKMTQVYVDAGVPDNMVFTYTYNDQKKISGMKVAGIIDIRYVYGNGKITKAELYSNNILGAYYVFTYTGERVTRKESFFEAGNGTFELDTRNDCSYYDNGNLKEIKNYIMNGAGQFVLTNTRQFLQFDNKKNPYEKFGQANMAIFLDFLNVNNIKHSKQVDADGSNSLEIETTYTYNNEGYPATSATRTTDNTIVTNTTAVFTYE